VRRRCAVEPVRPHPTSTGADGRDRGGGTKRRGDLSRCVATARPGSCERTTLSVCSAQRRKRRVQIEDDGLYVAPVGKRDEVNDRFADVLAAVREDLRRCPTCREPFADVGASATARLSAADALGSRGIGNATQVRSRRLWTTFDRPRRIRIDWSDIAIGLGIAGLFVSSAASVIPTLTVAEARTITED